MLPAAILCGGLGTRMRPLTDTVPKSLIEVEGKPFLLWQLEYLRFSGIQNIVLNVCHMEDQIREVVANNPITGLSITFVSDGDTPSGTASALRRALPILGKQFFVTYGDCLPLCDFDHVLKFFERSQKPALMAIYFVGDNRGNVIYKDGLVSRYDKFFHEENMQYRDYGFGILSASVLEQTAHDDLAHVYNSLGSNIAGYLVGLQPYEIGSFTGLERTQRYFRHYQAIPSRS